MTDSDDVRRPFWVDAVIVVLAFIIFVTMVSLGNWQIRRLAWKLDLIEAVETRAGGTPVALPQGSVTQDEHGYLRVETRGTYRHDLSLRVKAVTELGGGHWIMTPLDTGYQYVWINRGFAPSGLAPSSWETPEGMQTVIGLLRITEPDGTLLETNAPETGRWVSRDVEAMTRAAGLNGAAPFFIDAEHAEAPDAWPRGGLTVVDFRNTHLSYALTWYAMALLFAGAMAYVIIDRLRSGRVAGSDP